MTQARAFTYIEFLCVVVVVAIVTLVATPDDETETNEQGRLAADLFETDVAFARSKSIARPDDPIVIKVDATLNRYWLAHSSSPDTPLPHPRDGRPYEVRFGPGGKVGMDQVQIIASDFGGDGTLKFDGTGGLDQSTSALLQLTSGDASYEVAVAPASSISKVTDSLSVNLNGGDGGVIGGIGGTVGGVGGALGL